LTKRQAYVRVTVVIPTKNRPSEVKRLLEELLRQTLRPYEVIVVDDSNDQRTKRAVESLKPSYQQKNILLRYTRNSNSLPRARLLGGLIAQGDIVVYTDDDLHLNPRTLEYLVLSLMKTDAVAIWGKIAFPDMKQAAGNKLVNLLGKFLRSLIFGGVTCEGGLFAVRRKVLSEGVFFDWNMPGYALFEDQDFSRAITKRYGLKSVIKLNSPVLAIDRGSLIKDEKFFVTLFGNYFYLCFKWRGILGLITFTCISPIICLFYIISKGGMRGKSTVSPLGIIKSYLYIIKRLSGVISGNLEETYASYTPFL